VGQGAAPATAEVSINTIDNWKTRHPEFLVIEG